MPTWSDLVNLPRLFGGIGGQSFADIFLALGGSLPNLYPGGRPVAHKASYVPYGDLSQPGPWIGDEESMGFEWRGLNAEGGYWSHIGEFPTLAAGIGEEFVNVATPPFMPQGGMVAGGGGVRTIERPPQYSLQTDVGPCPPGRRYAIRNGQGYCRTNRRMNVLNPKALTRATRRVTGFQVFAAKAEKTLQAIVRKSGFKSPRRGGCNTCGKRKCACR